MIADKRLPHVLSIDRTQWIYLWIAVIGKQWANTLSSAKEFEKKELRLTDRRIVGYNRWFVGLEERQVMRAFGDQLVMHLLLMLLKMVLMMLLKPQCLCQNVNRNLRFAQLIEDQRRRERHRTSEGLTWRWSRWRVQEFVDGVVVNSWSGSLCHFLVFGSGIDVGVMGRSGLLTAMTAHFSVQHDFSCTPIDDKRDAIALPLEE